MSSEHMRKFDFRRFLSLGREVSEEHTEFKALAPLDVTESETEAFFMWLEYMDHNPDVDLITAVRELNRLFGMSHYVTSKVKEVGRLCLMLGDTTPKAKYKKGKPE